MLFGIRNTSLRFARCDGQYPCCARVIETAGDQAAEVGPENRILAVTVDFFRKGSYAPALAATASFLDPSASASPKPAQPPGKAKSTSAEGDKSSGNTTLRGGDSDTEPVVCMLWLQVRTKYLVAWRAVDLCIFSLLLRCLHGAHLSRHQEAAHLIIIGTRSLKRVETTENYHKAHSSRLKYVVFGSVLIVDTIPTYQTFRRHSTGALALPKEPRQDRE